MYQKPMLKKFAVDLRLDAAKFNQCLDSDETLPAIQADVAEGSQLGVQGTPTFFANGQLLQLSSLDFEAFQRLLDPLLK